MNSKVPHMSCSTSTSHRGYCGNLGKIRGCIAHNKQNTTEEILMTRMLGKRLISKTRKTIYQKNKVRYVSATNLRGSAKHGIKLDVGKLVIYIQ